MGKQLLLLGSGGHSKVLISILKSQDEKVEGYFDIEDKGQFMSSPYLGIDIDLLRYDNSEYEIINGVGDIETRNRLFNFFKERNYSFKTVIHQKALLAIEVKLGEGIHILGNAIIQPYSEIGDNSIINSGAIVEHDCHIDRGVHLSPGTVLSGGVKIGESSHLGSNCTILPNIVIGKNVVIGAGSVVTRNIKENVICWGNPAIERRKND